MTSLDGSSMPIEIAPGYRLTAPGLLGTVTTREGFTLEIQGLQTTTRAFNDTLEVAGITDSFTVEMDVQSIEIPAGESAIRTPTNEDGLIFEVPYPEEDQGQVVLAVDEDGTMTWNFPLNEQNQIETPSLRGTGKYQKFIVRRNVPSVSTTEGSSNRSLFGLVGKKLLKVLVYPVSDPVLGKIGDFFANKWEQNKRPYLVRSFTPVNYIDKGIPALQPGDWTKLAAGPSLLFIHGTTSTAQTGFASFPPDTLAHLHQVYENRVFAFNHFTLSESPEQNAAWFIQQLPPGLFLKNIDIVCHSRGGLVARMLAGELNPSTRSRLTVRRIVFVGSPNNGTALANPENLTSFLDRYTTFLNVAPPGPIGVASDILEGIVTVVKMIAHGALNGLDGLTAMNPNSPFMKSLNTARIECDTQYYAITSDYEPQGGLKDIVKDGVIDRIFGEEKNDLLVPTDGVYKDSKAKGFPIPDNRVLIYTASDGVGHSDYFSKPKTSEKLKEWLLARS